MLPKGVFLKRLALIKNLCRAATEQSKLPETLAYVSVLMFHDAIDMFMQLSAEHIGLAQKKGKHTFLMDYFDLLPQLQLKASVDKVNNRRNNLKHSGLIPAKLEIEETKITCESFFNSNCPLIFNVSFEEISLLDLISIDSVKQFLQLAEKSLLNGELIECCKDVRRAFYELTNDSPDDDRLKYHLNNHISLPRDRYAKIGNERFDHFMENMKSTYDKNFQAVKKSFFVISLGIDYRKYLKFEYLAPPLIHVWSDTQHGHFPDKDKYVFAGNIDGRIMVPDECRFLIDFVTDCAVKVQEFSLS